ncbi:MAG: hypothetical protein H6662_02095 [Ardenticatenaceae bacterium]|nr:hypothetical protein [Anaerolineales bacterium]MCB8920351.1 hypothetical protein [Ardenticatenaceae bacterium]MCB8989306.1 hypothetical protein [Ardenticatenaceae bacterium]
MTLPQIPPLTFEENDERLKVTIPLKRNWLLFGLFTLSMVIWVAMIVVVVVFIFRDVLPNRERYTFTLTTMMVVWLIIWYYLGQVIWGRWQYYTANREILFINAETLVVRRPVSILGITDAYDMQYANPFYYNEAHRCPAFDYGSQRVYFGQELSEENARALMRFLNGRFFPQLDDDED